MCILYWLKKKKTNANQRKPLIRRPAASQPPMEWNSPLTRDNGFQQFALFFSKDSNLPSAASTDLNGALSSPRA